MHNLTVASALSLSSVFALGCGPSLASMHATAASGQVQSNAPLHARRSVAIAAPRERVWSILTAFEDWPAWQPNISSVTAPRALMADEPFRWVNGTSEISSRLALVLPVELLVWTGSVSTAKAIHLWRLSSPTPDSTLVEVEETMDGFLLTWFYGQKDLDAEVTRSLANLRKAAESPAR